MGKKAPIINIKIEEGAPDWVVTFGDLMSLLLCFFVLLLSFSSMDTAKYKELAGSLEKAFGVQRKTENYEMAKGIKIVARDFDQDLKPQFEKEEFVSMQTKEEIGEEIKKAIKEFFGEQREMIQVDVGKDEIKISLMGETAFDSGKATLKRKMIPLLVKIADMLNKARGEVIVAGHTDNIPLLGGKYKSNLGLSMARSARVADYLLETGKVNPQRVSTMGFGEYRPVSSNDTSTGRQKNRRVEIILKTKPAKK